MRHHTAEHGAAVKQRPADRDQRAVPRPHAGAVAVGIDLDQHGKRIPPLGAAGRNEPCRV